MANGNGPNGKWIWNNLAGLIAIGGAIAGYATLRNDVNTHLAQATIHKPQAALEQKVDTLKEDFDDFKGQYNQDQTRQVQRDLDITRALGELKGAINNQGE